MARIITIKIEGEKGPVDGCVIAQDDNGDFSVEGDNDRIVDRVLELMETGITIGEDKYDNSDTFMDGLLREFDRKPYVWAQEEET